MDVKKTKKTKLQEFYLYCFSTLVTTYFVGSLAGMTMLSTKFDFTLPVNLILLFLLLPILYFGYMTYRSLRILINALDLNAEV
ncbi:hypothetical protein [Pseudoalteromonas denitrificans]|uniref:Uncharacterized protein n=1 Tax=Pseudoalteromonas denitrificans DSM 6059 TaxID=1123010 RepID=A0A1I1GWU5_9GAMM|nr:hypothetical protein [Pseudoalteromonas denitrificans]SFC14308.1 hypothetical protein SAMN02745724_01009 [Pseudoalteromonas denitrificans DSM 6059]